MKHNSYHGIDPRITRIIASEVEKLNGRYGIYETELADFEQDLHVAVWSALLDLHDVAIEKAVHQIVNHAVIDLLRRRERMRRDWRVELFSTNACCEDEEEPDEDMAHTLDLEHELRSRFGLPPVWHCRRDTAADLADALAGLPNELRRLADVLDACGGNLSDAARCLGLSRKKARLMLKRLQESLAWLRD